MSLIAVNGSAQPVQSQPAPEAPVEGQPVAEAAPPKKDFTASAVLAKQQREIRRLQQQLKSQEDSIKSRQLEMEQQKSSYEKDYIPRNRLSENPLEALKSAGLSDQQIIDSLMNQPTQESQMMRQLAAEVKALRDAQEKQTQTYTEQQKHEIEQAINQIRADATSMISNNPAYEIIKETGSIETVVKLIKRNFEENNVVMGIEEAANEVEEYLFEEYQKIARLPKILAKINPVTQMPETKAELAPQPKSIIPQQAQVQKQQIKTLTHATTVAPSRRLSERDRIERAKLAYKGQLT